MLNSLRRSIAKATRVIRRAPGLRKSKTFQAFVRSLSITDAFREKDYRQFAQEAYEKNPYVYAAINEIARAVGEIPPVLYRVNPNGEQVQNALGQRERKVRKGYPGNDVLQRAMAGIIDREAKKVKDLTGLPNSLCRDRARKRLVERGELEQIESHELLDLLERPNPWKERSYSQFMEATVHYLEIGGEVLWEPIRGGGQIREMYVHPPDEMELTFGDRLQPIRQITIQRDGEEIDFEYDPRRPEETEVYFLRYFHPRKSFRGMSPIQAAARSINVNNQGRTWNLSLLQNGAQLSGIVTSKGELTDVQKNSLTKQFKKQYQGASNAGKVISISGAEGLDWKPTGATPNDMAWADLNKASSREVAIIHGTPPEILGDSSQKTYSNYKEARRAFYKEKVIPTTNTIFGQFNISIVPTFGENLFLDYDTSRVEALQEDVNEMHERVRKDVESSLLMINEGRKVIGWDEVDGGDVILVSGSQIPLDAAVGGGGTTELPSDGEGEEEAASILRVEKNRTGPTRGDGIPEDPGPPQIS